MLCIHHTEHQKREKLFKPNDEKGKQKMGNCWVNTRDGLHRVNELGNSVAVVVINPKDGTYFANIGDTRTVFPSREEAQAYVETHANSPT